MLYIDELGLKALKAKNELIGISTNVKDHILRQMAKELITHSDFIIAENAKDVKAAREKGVKESLVDRLLLTPSRIEAMAKGLIETAQYPDPIGRVLYSTDMPQGMKLKKVSVPMGVIGIIDRKSVV